MAFPTQLGTTVRNISGAPRFFSYLGTHGITLANNTNYLDEGDLLGRISAPGSSNRAKRSALVADLQAGRVSIIQNPRAMDAGAAGAIKALVIDGSDAFAVETLNYNT